MLIPYSTDAPIYHLPFATVGIMVANIVALVAVIWGLFSGNLELETVEAFALQFDTINPIQWITAAFLHAGPFHLIGNMIFLWAFGLIIEGKIGSLAFAVLYFGITAIDNAGVQIVMFLIGSEDWAVGASGTIFALMVIALIWAPENCMDVVLILLFRGFKFEVRVVTLAGFYIALEVITLFFNGFTMSSAMLHMAGVLVGAPVGLLMLNRGMVDCEDWDIIARNEWLQEYRFLCPADRYQRLRAKEDGSEDAEAAELAGRYSLLTPSTKKSESGSSNRKRKRSIEPSKSEPVKSSTRGPLETGKEKRKFSMPWSKSIKNEPEPRARPEPKRPSESSRAHPDYNRLNYLLRQALEQSSVVTAEHHFEDLRKKDLIDGLADSTLKAYIKLMSSAGQHLATLMPLHVLADRDGEHADRARLQIAKVQLKVLKTPVEALKTLGKIQDYPEQDALNQVATQGEQRDLQRKVLQQKEALIQQCQQSQQ